MFITNYNIWQSSRDNFSAINVYLCKTFPLRPRRRTITVYILITFASIALPI